MVNLGDQCLLKDLQWRRRRGRGGRVSHVHYRRSFDNPTLCGPLTEVNWCMDVVKSSDVSYRTINTFSDYPLECGQIGKNVVLLSSVRLWTFHCIMGYCSSPCVWDIWNIWDMYYGVR